MTSFEILPDAPEWTQAMFVAKCNELLTVEAQVKQAKAKKDPAVQTATENKKELVEAEKAAKAEMIAYMIANDGLTFKADNRLFYVAKAVCPKPLTRAAFDAGLLAYFGEESEMIDAVKEAVAKEAGFKTTYSLKNKSATTAATAGKKKSPAPAGVKGAPAAKKAKLAVVVEVEDQEEEDEEMEDDD